MLFKSLVFAIDECAPHASCQEHVVGVPDKGLGLLPVLAGPDAGTVIALGIPGQTVNELPVLETEILPDYDPAVPFFSDFYSLVESF